MHKSTYCVQAANYGSVQIAFDVRKSAAVIYVRDTIILYKIQRHRPAVVVNGLTSYCVHLR